MGKQENKPLCKLVKKGLVKDDFPTYSSLVNPGDYICLKCGRVASRKKFLCKGKRIEKKEKEKKKD